MSQRVVVFGGAGQVGVELVRAFRARDYDVIPVPREQVDITDAAAVEHRVATLDPAVVLNAAAYNMVDVAEKEPQAAFLVNGLAVRNLALACRQSDALLVHFSTDYVFDGELRRPYTEDDKPHPLSAYAVSKYAGELYAQAYLADPLIIRTCGVFGPGGLGTARGNFIETMLRVAKSSQTVRAVEDHVGSPTYAPDLGDRVADLVVQGARGVFHVAGGTPISWYRYAQLIFELAGLSPELRATSEREYRTAARRPKYSALSNAKMESAGIAPMRPLREALAMYLELRRSIIRSR